jgi:beta-glucosidase-like glycosyl hydrolase
LTPRATTVAPTASRYSSSDGAVSNDSGLLRDSLGFRGVVVTDALDAPTPAATPHAPARAIEAGVDLLLYTSGSAADRGYATLLQDASASARLRAQVAAASARIQALKDWLGRRCSG